MSYLIEEIVKNPKPSYKEKLQELLFDPEEEELLETRKILDKIYVNQTVLLPKERYHQLSRFVIAVDVTHYSMTFCPTCKCHQPLTARATERWVCFHCSECNESLLFLWRNDR